MNEFLSRVYFSNPLSDYLIFLISLTASFVALRIIGRFLAGRLRKWLNTTRLPIDDLLFKRLKKYFIPIVYFVVFYLNTKILYLNASLSSVVNKIVFAFTIILAAIILSSAAAFLLSRHWENNLKEDSGKLALKWIIGIIRFVIWGTALILFLDNVGVKVNSLLTGLGISGIAVAFAAQAILTDIFCFFTIFLDRPFEIGDFIVSGEQMGTVEHIGLKTTRLRSLNGEQLIFSNTDLTGKFIKNFKTLQQRRVVFSIGVKYDTPSDRLAEIPALIKQIVEDVPGTKFGRTHFCAYGDFSLNFEIVYYVLDSDYDIYMDINQAINLRIKEEFDGRGIQFAFPTRTVELYSMTSLENGSTRI